MRWIAALGMLLALATPAICADDYIGTVVAVQDGETIKPCGTLIRQPSGAATWPKSNEPLRVPEVDLPRYRPLPEKGNEAP